MKNRSSAYRFTFARGDVVGQQKLDDLRKEMSNTGYRVCVKGRLGVNNPAAVIYQERAKRQAFGAYQTIKLEHAGRFDVYVYMR